MSEIFEGDSDTEISLKVDNQYAKNYDQWRKKEELNKLKTKYQDEWNSGESTESEDDEKGIELTEEVEKDFFKTLACLKNKDPKIYNENVRFFEVKDNEHNAKTNKDIKNKSVYLKDYERQLILDKNGILSDEDDEGRTNHLPTYVEEQQQAKDQLKQALHSVDDNNDEWGGIFTKRNKTAKENDQEEKEYKQWLAGQKTEISDEQTKSDLKPLKDYWNNPDLDDGEKFLRDYILKKQFLDKGDEDYIPTYDEIVHDSDELSNDEELLTKQEEFEHKYNFRFEEPDQEFIKRYPRTMENSLRKKDDKRKQKRQEVKERKKMEKETKMQDLKKLQELKRNEIEEKLHKLKEITGNATLGFADDDLEGEFNPEKHDKRMRELFDDGYYDGPEGDQKPEFPEIDKELELENWNHFYRNENNESEGNAPHCEDDDFNMDCDFDADATTQQEIIVSTKTKKKHKKRSKFAEAVQKPKPTFDPGDKTYEEYFDEYYKLDCEDFIGDIPCRFKYKKVIPNSFGLTIEEILTAKERELNKWCSLKKTVQIRPEHVEKYDQIAYKKKSNNIDLKKKILPSLFTIEEIETPGTSVVNKNKDELIKIDNGDLSKINTDLENVIERPDNDVMIKNKKKKKKIETEKKLNISSDQNKHISRRNNVNKHFSKEQVASEGKLNSKSEFIMSKNSELHQKVEKSLTELVIKKKNNKLNSVIPSLYKINSKTKRKCEKSINENDNLKKSKHLQQAPLTKLSDERLAAYGIKPKRFKNKLKYKK